MIIFTHIKKYKSQSILTTCIVNYYRAPLLYVNTKPILLKNQITKQKADDFKSVFF